MDDGAGGETHPMAYVDDAKAFVPWEDAWFFCTEFRRRAKLANLEMNCLKTRICTSTSGESAIPAVRRKYGVDVAESVIDTINEFSVEVVTIDDDEVRRPKEVVDGLRILGHPVGNIDFVERFFAERIEENKAQAQKLLATVTDKHTALRLFLQCTLHKLPHLLGTEVLYRFRESAYDGWNDWNGPLAAGIHEMVDEFLATITQRNTIPLDSRLIAYISIAQGGLGLMDASARAIPDFVLTMSRAARYAAKGASFSKDADPLPLPHTLASLFATTTNPESTILSRFHRLLGATAPIGAPAKCNDPFEYFLHVGSLNSARDRLKQEASRLRRGTLMSIARDSLKPILCEILISSTSYPLVHMSRSTPAHRRPNDLFLISLKQKLHLEIFPPSNCPKCLCGTTIDPFAFHTFSCRRVSKKIAHDRIRDDTAPILERLLQSGGYIGRGSHVEIEPKKVVPELPTLRPFDSAFRPTPNLRDVNARPCPYTHIGIDFVITPPLGHTPPSRSGAASNNQSATAAKHLIEKERGKLMRAGKSDTYNHITLTGDQIIHNLLSNDKALIPAAISPLGRWGHMFHFFLFGRRRNPHPTFPATRPAAATMYRRISAHPCPNGIIPAATSTWKRHKKKREYFYGHSYTAPTPKEFALGKLGLAISNALALHIRDVKLGNLTEPTDETDDDFISTTEIHLPAHLAPAPGFAPTNQTGADTDLERDFDDPTALWNEDTNTNPTYAYYARTSSRPLVGLNESFLDNSNFNLPTAVVPP
jgi:hypothetical protein